MRRIAVIFGIIIVLLVNLSAAHYRNLLDLKATLGDTPGALEAFNAHTSTFPRFFINSEICDSILTSPMGESIGSAATNAMCRPFALHSLDAMVLFALGLAISAIAAFEGRKADAAFPGFSDAARQIERARRDLQYALEDYYDSYEDVLEDAEKDFGKLTPRQKITLRRAMDARVAPFRRLLETDPDIMRDEFDVPEEVVEHITGKIPMIRPRAGNDA